MQTLRFLFFVIPPAQADPRVRYILAKLGQHSRRGRPGAPNLHRTIIVAVLDPCDSRQRELPRSIDSLCLSLYAFAVWFDPSISSFFLSFVLRMDVCGSASEAEREHNHRRFVERIAASVVFGCTVEDECKELSPFFFFFSPDRSLLPVARECVKFSPRRSNRR